MRTGCGADDTTSMPGRDSRCVMYIPKEWAETETALPQTTSKRGTVVAGVLTVRLRMIANLVVASAAAPPSAINPNAFLLFTLVSPFSATSELH